jgi:hypothetical protein
MTDTTRRIRAQCSVSIDGYSSGPGGTAEDTWLYEHAGQESNAAHFEGIWRGCSTALMGRTNYEGFHSAAPGDPRGHPVAAPALCPRVTSAGTRKPVGFRHSRATVTPPRAADQAVDGMVESDPSVRPFPIEQGRRYP